MMKFVKTGITMAAFFAMTLQINGQNMVLTTKQQALVAIAANEAKGNIDGLKAALNEGLEKGHHSNCLILLQLQF